MNDEQIAKQLFNKYTACENYKWNDLPNDNSDKRFWLSVVVEVRKCLEK